MKAAVFRKKKLLVVEEVPDPVPADDEVVLKVKYCAICGSDIHRYMLGMMNPGFIMGHEYSGEVVECGKSVTELQVGDRVVRWGGKITLGRELPNFPPRFNTKTRGFLPQKPGAYAEYMAVHHEKVNKLPQEVSLLDASLVEPLAFAVHAVRASEIRLGDSAVVIGAGPIGLFVLQAIAAAGGLQIFVSDPNPHRLRVASELGATAVYQPDSVDLVDEIVALTDIGPDLVFECAGAKTTLQQGFEMVRMGGKVMMLALAWHQVDCLPVEWIAREVEMKACFAHLNSDWAVALELMRTQKAVTKPIITKVIPLDQIQDAFQELLQPDTAQVQIVVEC
jgi:threonine dehydrogenase-like Zn-dependent dehydrogenase